MKIVSVLLLLPLVAAINLPESAVDRDLLKIQTCQAQLNSCKATGGGSEIPFEEWRTFLSAVPGNSSYGLTDIANIIDLAEQIMVQPWPVVPAQDGSFIGTITGIITEITGLVRQIQNIIDLFTNTVLPDPNGTFVRLSELVTSLGNSINSLTGAAIPTELISLLSAMLFFTAGLLPILETGLNPVMMILFLVQSISLFVGVLSRNAMRYQISGESADMECLAELNECSFQKMIKESVPLLVGSSFLVAADRSLP